MIEWEQQNENPDDGLSHHKFGSEIYACGVKCKARCTYYSCDVRARKTICLFCACCWKGRIPCYFPVFSLHELISTLQGEDTQPWNNELLSWEEVMSCLTLSSKYWESSSWGPCPSLSISLSPDELLECSKPPKCSLQSGAGKFYFAILHSHL